MSVRVEIQPEALKQIEALDQWWRRNRPAAADLVLDEMDRVVELLAEAPEIGTPYREHGLENVRSVRLRRTPYKAYYHFEPGAETVTILTVWSAVRKLSPQINLPPGHR